MRGASEGSVRVLDGELGSPPRPRSALTKRVAPRAHSGIPGYIKPCGPTLRADGDSGFFRLIRGLLCAMQPGGKVNIYPGLGWASCAGPST
jgi:hypothetical protein